MTASNEVPHADLIRAVLDGATIQWRSKVGDWADFTSPPLAIRSLVVSGPYYDFRVKPRTVVRWHPIWPGGHTGDGFSSKDALATEAWKNEYQPGWKALRIELDPDTLAVIDARTEEP